MVSSTYWLYIWVTWWVSNKRLKLLTLHEHLSSPRFYGGVRVAHLYLFFCVVLLCVFTFWVPCCGVRYDFRRKWCSVRFYLQLFGGGMMFGSFLPPVVWRGVMSCLRCLCLFACCRVQHILCCIFLRIGTLCCQFLLIVHFWLPVRYSLTFI